MKQKIKDILVNYKLNKIDLSFAINEMEKIFNTDTITGNLYNKIDDNDVNIFSHWKDDKNEWDSPSIKHFQD